MKSRLIFVLIALLIFAVVAFLFWEKYQQKTAMNIPSDWTRVKTKEFSVALPPGWAFHPLQGIDSYVGEFAGDGVSLQFDFGMYANPLAQEGDPEHTVTFEKNCRSSGKNRCS